MELRHLRTFVTVAETLNISAAARRLRVTQPALSRHIRDLKHVVGHDLFVRHPDGLRLTPAGLTLRERSAKVLAAVKEVLEETRVAGSREAAVVRLGYYGISVWETLLAPALEGFARRFPHVTLKMAEESSVHLACDLREGKLDVALLSSGDYESIPGVVTQLAATTPAVVMVAANHRLAKKRSVSLADLRDEEFIGLTPEDAPGRYRTFIAACREAGFAPRINYLASIFPELCLAVKQRMGVAIISSFGTDVPHPGVVFIKLRHPVVPMPLYVARTTLASAAALQLAETLAASAARAAQRVCAE